MNHQESRVCRMEKTAVVALTSRVLIFAELGEAADEAIRRSGHDPDDPAKAFIVLSWASTADVDL